jgi:beta-glucosidase
VDQLPPFHDYDMAGRTYRYFGGDPVFPFGFGLSFTSFHYRDLRVPETVRIGDSIQVSVEVENGGPRPGEEVAQLYVTDLEASRPRPIRSLRGFQRIFLEPGARTRVVFHLTPRDLALVDAEGTHILEPGRFRISVGGQQPGFVGVSHASTTETMEAFLVVTGRPLVLSR